MLFSERFKWLDTISHQNFKSYDLSKKQLQHANNKNTKPEKTMHMTLKAGLINNIWCGMAFRNDTLSFKWWTPSPELSFKIFLHQPWVKWQCDTMCCFLDLKAYPLKKLQLFCWIKNVQFKNFCSDALYAKVGRQGHAQRIFLSPEAKEQ